MGSPWLHLSSLSRCPDLPSVFAAEEESDGPLTRFLLILINALELTSLADSLLAVSNALLTRCDVRNKFWSVLILLTLFDLAYNLGISSLPSLIYEILIGDVSSIRICGGAFRNEFSMAAVLVGKCCS